MSALGRVVDESSKNRLAIPRLRLCLTVLAWIGLGSIYATIFVTTQMETIAGAIRRSLISIIPAVLLSIPVWLIVTRWVIKASLWLQVLVHVGMGTLFSLLWYLGIQTGYGLQEGWLLNGLGNNRFYISALVWQLLQGFLLYGTIAAVSYAMNFQDRIVQLEGEASGRAGTDTEREQSIKALSRLLVRSGRDIVPVEIDDIILISGASDFVEIITAKRRFTSTKSLAELTDLLPSAFFERVHRSHIVRLDKILSVNSLGDGRLELTLDGKETVITSRAGAQRFRQRTA